MKHGVVAGSGASLLCGARICPAGHVMLWGWGGTAEEQGMAWAE